MAFTVEDGTLVADANSYTTVDFADSYFTDRQVTGWTGADAVKEAALIRATDYVEQRFGQRFIGYQVDADQALSWPRYADDYEETEIPVKLQRAVCEYALRALTATLAPDPTLSTEGATVVTTSKKLGPLEKHFEVIHGPQLLKSYPAADMLLQPLLIPASGRTYR